MATVTLTQGFFHLSSDLSTYIDLPINSINASEVGSSGGIVDGINGRRRIVTRPGLASSYNFTLVMVDIADVEVFRTFTNKEILYRGPRGRKFYGFISGLSFNESPGPTDKTRGLSFTMSDITKTDEDDG